MINLVKYVLAAFLVIVGACMLKAGYDAPNQAESEIKTARKIRFDSNLSDALEDITNAAVQKQAEFEYQLKHLDATPIHTAPHDELPGPQLRPMFDRLDGDLLDGFTRSTYAVNGVTQYCAGWLLIAAACIVVVSKNYENKPETN